MTHDRVLLCLLRDAARRIEEYCSEGAARYRHSPLLQDGILRQLRVICDVAKRLSPTMRARAATVPWDDFADLANILARDFFGVSTRALWNTAMKDVPPLRHAANLLLAQASSRMRTAPGKHGRALTRAAG